MNDFWGAHPWLIIVLLAMGFPLLGMIIGAMAQYNYFRHRREALETLKVYASQGKDPPPEVVDALTGWGGRRWRRYWRDAASTSAAGAAGAGDWAAASTAYITARAERWRAREPYRRWHNALFMIALTAGLYFASKHIHDAVIADRFLVATIIVGALTVAAVLSALMVTVFRPR